ncbi:MAG: DUF192 domain-containing protein [Paracoccaceae bacterium]
MGFGQKINLSIAAIVFTLVAGQGSAQECATHAISLRGDWGQARFSIEIADNGPERAQGLMNREQMARTSGMLFIYEAPQSVAFWMRNTLIPLDMIFIDPTGAVASVHENAVPLDETAIPGGRNIQYVLEINGGMSKLLGISVGSQVLHPEIDQKIAVWRCEVQ